MILDKERKQSLCFFYNPGSSPHDPFTQNYEFSEAVFEFLGLQKYL